jgi:hypothetical protein
MPPKTRAIALFAVLTAAATYVLVAIPPVLQDESYHQFADQRTIWGIPNFWNVISNLAFLVSGVWGIGALRRAEAFRCPWERAAFGVLLAGVLLTAAGSAYYHLRPNNGTLVWDRLPMTLAFLSLFSMTIGERIDPRLGRALLLPLLVAGTASVLYWKATGDLRSYGLTQFVPLIAIPAMLLLFPAHYSHSGGIWAMAGLYVLAKAVELYDRPIGALMATGGHPWKHVLAAAAVACYVAAVRRRRPSDARVLDHFGISAPVNTAPLRSRLGNSTELATTATEPRPLGSGCPLEPRNPQNGYAPLTRRPCLARRLVRY